MHLGGFWGSLSVFGVVWLGFGWFWWGLCWFWVVSSVWCHCLCSFSKGKRSNLRRSSVQMTLTTLSELVTPHVPTDSSESLMEEPSRRTRRNKTTAPAETEPVKRSTRNKGGAKAQLGYGSVVSINSESRLRSFPFQSQLFLFDYSHVMSGHLVVLFKSLGLVRCFYSASFL